MRGTMTAAVAVVGLLLAQPASQSYVGTWTADLSGQLYVRLELATTDGVLGGRISLGDIHVNSEGDVEAVLNLAQRFTPIFDVVLHDATLSFARKDGDDTDRFEMRLITNGAAQLTFVPTEEDRAELLRAGVPLPKPIRLKKSTR
jgi:hypothetical protein